MAYVLPAERGSVLTLLHPSYSVVVPQPDTIKLPIAYPLARGDERWVRFINTWLDLKRRDGTIDALYRHWILGEHAARPKPRWSVVTERAALGGVTAASANRNHEPCGLPASAVLLTVRGTALSLSKGRKAARVATHPVPEPQHQQSPEEHVRLQNVEPRRGQALERLKELPREHEGQRQRR